MGIAVQHFAVSNEVGGGSLLPLALFGGACNVNVSVTKDDVDAGNYVSVISILLVVKT